MDAIKQLKKQGYEPSREELRWFNGRLKKEFGLNRFDEPNYRVVNGRNQTCFRNGDANAIKYLNFSTGDQDCGLPYPIIEEWWSPERLGSKEEWEECRYAMGETSDGYGKLDVLGEYPSRGLYFMFGGRPLMNAVCEPLPLTEEVLSQLIGMIKNKRAAVITPQSQARAIREIQERAAKEQERVKQASRAEMDNIWERYQSTKEQINLGMGRAYSLPAGYKQKGALIVPENH